MCIGNSFHRPRKRTCHHGGRFNFGRRILEQHYFIFDAFKQNRQKMDDHRYPSTFAHCNILILTTRCHQKEDETMSRHITWSNTKVFAFLGLYYSQVYSPNRQRGRNQKQLRSVGLDFQNKYGVSCLLQNGARYVKKTEIIKDTENKEHPASPMDNAHIRNNEVEVFKKYLFSKVSMHFL